jgi:methylase of polypeptide subunit release factors
MHVLEHVGSPREFVLDALKYLQPNGPLYLEIPLELDPEVAKQFESRVVDRCVTIHEHINQFNITSLARLIESIVSLRLVKVEAVTIGCG